MPTQLLRPRRGLAVLLFVLAGVPALAQPSFDSGSTGADGALNLTTPGTVVFDPTAFTPRLDADGDGIYHFTTIQVASGVTVKFQADKAGPRPIIWLAQGDVTIAGTLDLNGPAGHHADFPVAPIPASGGFLGGFGCTLTAGASGGQGPGAGAASTLATGNPGGSGAGHLVTGGTGTGNGPAGSAYGNVFLQPLVGGSGGGGGGQPAATAVCRGGGGGGGGGALLLASSGRILLSGSLQAKGGDGAIGTSNCGGGGGSGGAIRLVATTLEGGGSVQVAGSTALGGGSSGAVGRTRLEALNQRYTGTRDINTVFSSPNALLPPAGGPRVRVVSVDGVAVPADPSGSYPLPDVTVNKSGPVTFAIEAENIPLGTVVKLRMFSESHQTTVVDSTPLAGTLASSTATATATLPTGISRFTVEARWTP